MTMRTLSSSTRGLRVALLLALAFLRTEPATAADAAGPVIPLPPALASDLALLGPGVVGKALPAPPISDLREYLNFGPGDWQFKIVAGGKDGREVATESFIQLPDQDGLEFWDRKLGTEYVEHIVLDPSGKL
jgi:hypothetical protein